MLLVQKWQIFYLFFLGNIGQNNVFYDILERPNAFLGCKNNNFKKYKDCHFSKGVNPCFLSKNEHVSNFFFYAIWARIMSFTIFQNQKKPFYVKKKKTKKFKTRKIDIFFKGVNPWFWSKNGHFSNFLFWAIKGRKMSFTIFQNDKTPFQAIKTRSLKSKKN